MGHVQAAEAEAADLKKRLANKHTRAHMFSQQCDNSSDVYRGNSGGRNIATSFYRPQAHQGAIGRRSISQQTKAVSAEDLALHVPVNKVRRQRRTLSFCICVAAAATFVRSSRSSSRGKNAGQSEKSAAADLRRMIRQGSREQCLADACNEG